MRDGDIQVAGDVHYGFYADLFSSRGLPLYPAVGDHEILDDRPAPMNQRWTPCGFQRGGRPDNRYYLVEHCKDVWGQHFTRPGGIRASTAARSARVPSGRRTPCPSPTR